MTVAVSDFVCACLFLDCFMFILMHRVFFSVIWNTVIAAFLIFMVSCNWSSKFHELSAVVLINYISVTAVKSISDVFL